ncbi:MAG: T9SS type A sorting domain-containing protein [Dyadobacter sp.]|uniref:T9SS type A sorting domain-containing protein n=1 Tax=Dyadobacter sp. TaxID=1914288 RepID=UPI0032669948
MKTTIVLGITILFLYLCSQDSYAQNTANASTKKNRLFFYPTASSNQPVKVNRRLLVFPNPAKDWVEIKFEGKHEVDQVLELHDKQGIQLHTQKWNSEKIDVSQLPPGVYIVTLKQNKQVYSQKLVVVKE